MEKTALAENLYQYQFPPNPGTHFGFNIFALIAGPDALLIDTGFEEHAAAVKDDLALEGRHPQQVIISHFHHDHMGGLKALPELTVLGSGRCWKATSEFRTRTPSEIAPVLSYIQSGMNTCMSDRPLTKRVFFYYPAIVLHLAGRLA